MLPIFKILFPLVILGFFVLLFLSALVKRKTANSEPKYKLDVRATPILSDNEHEFFHRLTRALPDYHIFPQVSFGALLQPAKTKSRKDYFSNLCKFNQKRADFVVCAKETLKILAVIELDDVSHNVDKDSKRDEILTVAGYRTIRFQSRKKPSEAEIAEHFSTRS
jgi:hypothetical protein